MDFTITGNGIDDTYTCNHVEDEGTIQINNSRSFRLEGNVRFRNIPLTGGMRQYNDVNWTTTFTGGFASTITVIPKDNDLAYVHVYP